MLTFFRRIRKSLIESGPFKKYLLYAIGEIALVVIGILIALQINNWNEWKKDRIKEIGILESLRDNLALIVQTVEVDIEHLHTLNHSAEIAIKVLEERLPFADSLGGHFHNARIAKDQMSLSQSGYEQYKNIGYDIIADDAIKQQVIHYFESTLPKWWTIYMEVNYKNESFYDYHVPLFNYEPYTLRPIDIESLYTDQYFRGWLKAYQGGRTTLAQMEQDLIEETNKVLQHIETKLAKKY